MKCSYYLEEGEFTFFTDKIKEISKKFKGEGTGKIDQILSWIKENIKLKKLSKENKNLIFRKRSASEIIQSKFATGCTDFTIVFITLARASGIPAKYIECINKEQSKKKILGHTFAEVFIDNKSFFIDPTHSKILSSLPEKYIIIGSGLDFADAGFRTLEDIKKKIRKLELF